MKSLLIMIFCSLLLTSGAGAQGIKDPSAWTMEVVTGSGTYDLVFHVALKPGWHVWSLNSGGDGTLIAPSFNFNKGSYTLTDSLREKGKLTETAMEGIDGKVRYYTGEAEFIQRVKARSGDIVKGAYTYQLCSESICLPPKTVPFSFRIP